MVRDVLRTGLCRKIVETVGRLHHSLAKTRVDMVITSYQELIRTIMPVKSQIGCVSPQEEKKDLSSLKRLASK